MSTCQQILVGSDMMTGMCGFLPWGVESSNFRTGNTLCYPSRIVASALLN
jgi:hypothetical protein